MPAVTAPSKVLVTGASGFLATHVVRRLLDDGYTVVGTVRSPAKGDYLAKLYDSDKFSYAIVEDMGKDDAFDQVVKEGNFDAIEHTASPFILDAEDPQDVIRPAVHGTTNILKSALAHGPQVRRVVITSSVQAIIEPKPAHQTPYTFTEADWNDDSVRAVETQGPKASGFDKYSASKSLAERAAWAFMKENAATLPFDLVTINPPYIWGPIIHDVRSVSALNESHAVFLEGIKTGSQKSAEESGAFTGNMVDVRDVAHAHSLVLEKAEAGGERFITASTPFSWQDIYDALNEAGVQGAPRGHPGSQQRNTYHKHDASKSTHTLGIQYLDLPQVALDTYQTLKDHFPSAL